MGAVCVLIKYFAESAWFLLLFDPRRSRSPMTRALSFGFVRLLIGREAMLVVSGAPRFGAGELVLYAALLIGRWFVWGLLLHIREKSVVPNSKVFPTPEKSRRWRLGGVLVSCLADVPALLTGLWVGRLWL